MKNKMLISVISIASFVQIAGQFAAGGHANQGQFFAMQSAHAEESKTAPLRKQPARLIGPRDIGYSQPVSKMPADSPVPIFPDAKFVSASEINSTSRQFFGRYNANSSMESVAAWYEQALKADGWTITIRPNKDYTGGMGLCAFRDKPKAGCSIRLDKQDGVDRNNRIIQSTNIGISVTIK